MKRSLLAVPSLIAAKRDGRALTDAELRAVVEGAARGDIPDYQLSALLMAIVWRGMTTRELTTWTTAMIDSGERLRWTALRPDDVAFITADHGNDPTTPGTDHTREQVPLLAFGPGIRPARLGTRASFCDMGQTIAEGLGVAPLLNGDSFLAALRGPA